MNDSCVQAAVYRHTRYVFRRLHCVEASYSALGTLRVESIEGFRGDGMYRRDCAIFFRQLQSLRLILFSVYTYYLGREQGSGQVRVWGKGSPICRLVEEDAAGDGG